jgi:hypothetical protein
MILLHISFSLKQTMELSIKQSLIASVMPILRIFYALTKK